VVPVTDGVCRPCRELDQAVVKQRRGLHRARGCLLGPDAARHRHTDASRRRAFAATFFLRLAGLQRPEHKLQSQDSSFLQLACANAHHSVRVIVQARGTGEPKQGKQRMQSMFRMLS